MKKLPPLLTLAILALLFSQPVIAQTQAKKDSIYQKMIAMKTEYPEGRRWTNDNGYSSKGGRGGLGCHAFALILSDAAFGAAPFRMHKNLGELKVGDILRVKKNTHSMIVLDIEGDKVTFAEGNYNRSIHWGRVLTMDQLATYGNYILTRYPLNGGS